MSATIVLLLLAGLPEPSSPLTHAHIRVTTQAGENSIKDLPGLMKRLYSTHQEERRLTKLQILSLAKQSAENRVKVGHELTAVLGQRQTPWATWYDIADLIGDLRFTEAIGELVKQLDYNNGVIGLSNSRWPAVRALIKIGDPAVPELERALNVGTVSIRARAVSALSGIGGPQAKRALERALAVEREESLQNSIRRSLAVAK